MTLVRRPSPFSKLSTVAGARSDSEPQQVEA